MMKLRSDAKPICLELAKRMYWDEGKSLHQVARYFSIHHTNLLIRFRRFNIPVRTHREAAKGPPLRYGKDNPAWKGGQYIDKRGYVHVRINGNVRYLHRVIAEQVLGRKLKENEAVHHIDGNRSNNTNVNLLICTRSYHNWLHAKMQNFKIGKYSLIKRS
jgi:hypothetical protein